MKKQGRHCASNLSLNLPLHGTPFGLHIVHRGVRIDRAELEKWSLSTRELIRGVRLPGPVGAAMTHRAVLVTLAHHMEVPGEYTCVTNTTQIVEETGLSRRRVQKYLALLEEDGWVTLQTLANRTVAYRINAERLFANQRELRMRTRTAQNVRDERGARYK